MGAANLLKDLWNSLAPDGSKDTTSITANRDGNIFERVEDIRNNVGIGRAHIGADRWDLDVGTDYWFGLEDIAIESASGWTDSNVSHQITYGNFFGDDAVWEYTRVPASGTSYLISPGVFGSALHKKHYNAIIGADPTTLVLEWFGHWQVASANEGLEAAGTGWSIGEDIPGSSGDWVAGVRSDGTNFQLRVLTTDRITGPAIDNADHKWKITFDGSTIEWFVDDVSQGTYATTLAGEFPLEFVPFYWNNGSTNDFVCKWAHIWYE